MLSTIYLSREVPISFTADKPLLSAIVFLVTAGVSLIILGRYLQKYDGRTGGRQYRALSLNEVGQPHPSRDPSPKPDDVRYASSQRKLRIAFVALVIAVCLRVEILLRVLGNVQCSSLTWEPIVPLVFALYDFWTVQRHQKRSPEHEDGKVGAIGRFERRVVHTPHRYVVAVGVMAVGGIFAIATTRSSGSTYICAASLSFHWLTPLLQRIGTILDILILSCVSRLLQEQEGPSARSLATRFSSVAWAFLVCTDIPRPRQLS